VRIVLFFCIVLFAPQLFLMCGEKARSHQRIVYQGPPIRTLEKRADMVLNVGKVGLNRRQLILGFRFIESKTKECVNFYTVHESRIPCLIERSELFHGFLLRSIQSKEAFIGRGCFKKVSKVILYGPQPKVLAECSAPLDEKHEIDILEQIRGGEGIVPYYGAVFRERKILSYYEYFPQGSIGSLFARNKPLDLLQTVKIFHDIAKGVRVLHEKGLVHRDLHEANVLVDITSQRCIGALIDFGFTVLAENANDGTVQGAVYRCPPEPLVDDLATIDRYAVDVYALGTLLYQAVWGKMVSWAGVYDIHVLHKYPLSERKELYERIVSLYEASLEQDVGTAIQKSQSGYPLTNLEKIQLLIYQMLDVVPERRPSIAKVSSVLEVILESMPEDEQNVESALSP